MVTTVTVFALALTIVAIGVELGPGEFEILEFTSANILKYSLVIVPFIAFVFMLRYIVLVREPIDLLFERSKLARRREVVETSLRKLETLRSADPESLLRTRDSI